MISSIGVLSRGSVDAVTMAWKSSHAFLWYFRFSSLRVILMITCLEGSENGGEKNFHLFPLFNRELFEAGKLSTSFLPKAWWLSVNVNCFFLSYDAVFWSRQRILPCCAELPRKGLHSMSSYWVVTSSPAWYFHCLFSCGMRPIHTEN